ncbi:MAG: hypothetical protein IPJ54_00155 [Saprospiraceae bacterium]|nr:hypothetical protein [Saprospiraceae bacterium]
MNGKQFYTEAFQNSKKFEFPSIAEIATFDFYDYKPEAYEALVKQHITLQEEKDQVIF